jgi:hypothetical protein
MNELSRLIGVFFEPKKAFADIAQTPHWLVPLLIAIVFAAGFSEKWAFHHAHLTRK